MSRLPALRRPLVLASVMAAMFMIAVEATIVATAMPAIAGQLGALHLYSWVFSSFLLTQTSTTVIFGKLADLYGRKPVLLVGIGIFLGGSTLCGIAWSMPSLIAFRLVQGIGAGAIQPVSLTVVGDLYPARERGRIQGYLSSVWGVSSVLGPLAGALIIQHLSWSWIFWINVPVGLAASVGFLASLHEEPARGGRSVDAPGAALFIVSTSALMVALTTIGSEERLAGLAATAIAIVGIGLFTLQERIARDPMLSLRVWAHRPIATANAASLLAGMALIGLTTFLPMYVQGVLNRSALVAGFALTMMVLGWPVGGTISSKIFTRVGVRTTLLAGAALLPAGGAVFVLLTPASGPEIAGFGSLVMGLGMGFLSTSAIIIVQECVGWHERGAATASNVFARNLGSTLGATALGALLNLRLPRAAADQVRQLLDHSGTAATDAILRANLAGALHLTFWGVFLLAAATLAAALLVPHVSLAEPNRR